MYTFKNTEINNKKASEFETKALLYLLGMRSDSEEIEIITIDCFNDVTGSNSDFSKLWDVQSKNHISLPPSKIGESLSTLYNNFISAIHFHEYILFIPKLNRDYLIEPNVNVYNYENIQERQKKGIENKLKEKINGNKSGKNPPLLFDFLSKIYFVEDNKKISTYIKKISKFRNKKSIPDAIYDRIFFEIRDRQTALKNSYIENEKIKHPSEVLNFNRHIRKIDINTLLISRLVGIDIFSFPGIPLNFFIVLNGRDEEEVKDLIQDCNENLSRAFFDKNGCREFWKVTESLIKILRDKPNDSVFDVYSMLESEVSVKTEYLTKETLLYMIALVKTGLTNAD